MLARARMIGTATLLALLAAACSDVTNPSSSIAPAAPSLSGSGTDVPGQVSGGGGGGGGQIAPGCGSISAQTYYITVYTTRTGIGVYGAATNCGTTREAFQVDVVDDNPNAACAISFPHYIAARYTDPNLSSNYAVNSTLVNCRNVLHSFTVTLRDTRTNAILATTTASAFL